MDLLWETRLINRNQYTYADRGKTFCLPEGDRSHSIEPVRPNRLERERL
jgi:hypothetical protein